MEITKTQLEFLKGNLDINKCDLRDLEIGMESNGTTRYFKSNKLNVKYTESYFGFGIVKSYIVSDKDINDTDNITIGILKFADYGAELFIKKPISGDKFGTIDLENKNIEKVLINYGVKILEEVEV